MNTKKVSGTFSGNGLIAVAPKRFLAPFLCAVLLVLITAGAAVLRLTSLDNRPMHCDEANQAVRFGQLLELGQYDYDPKEHHGPSLYFLTLPIAWAASADELTGVTEVQLRLLPAIFGLALVGMVWLLRAELGYAAVLCAAVLTAVSPAMVFYSRYYIQEMLLVCFTFGAVVALRRFTRHLTPKVSEEPRRTGRAWIWRAFWLVLLGLSVGMMHASKETCVIALFAMVPAAVIAIGDLRRAGWKQLLLSGLLVSITAASVSAVLFSSFLKDTPEVVESYTAYAHYADRASGEGTSGPHDKPWDYYFRILFWWQKGSGPVWSEAAIAALALVGLVGGMWGKGLKPAHLPMVRFLGIYTALITVIYSAIPYKTPWCALGLLHGMILLGGVGMAVLVRAAPGYVLKGAVIALLIAASGHLAWQAYRASFVDYEDVNNPYVYAHTTRDVPLLARRIKEIAALHADGQAMHIQVICSDGDPWPLPWYLRGFSRVGFFDHVPRGPAAPLIITQPKMEDVVLAYAYTNHVPGQPIIRQALLKEGDADWQLRPHVPLLVIVRLDLWEAYWDAQAQIGKAATGGRAKGP